MATINARIGEDTRISTSKDDSHCASPFVVAKDNSPSCPRRRRRLQLCVPAYTSPELLPSPRTSPSSAPEVSVPTERTIFHSSTDASTSQAEDAGHEKYVGDVQDEPGTCGIYEVSDEAQSTADWIAREFKTVLCRIPEAHSHGSCPYHHCDRDRRRCALGDDGSLLYRSEPCEHHFDDQRVCPQGDACRRCHNTTEVLYHPDLFCKRLCQDQSDCPRGPFCAFAHAVGELLTPHFGHPEDVEITEDFLIDDFKTQWCPIGGPHDWESCIYSHSYRDWRRSPRLGYSSRPCPQWSRHAHGPRDLSYRQRCKRGFACSMAHGAKEQLYHPSFYKTSPCGEVPCRRGIFCAFTHNGLDVRSNACCLAATAQSQRGSMTNAELFLRERQPTYNMPPKYHLLEERAMRSGAEHCSSRKSSKPSTQLDRYYSGEPSVNSPVKDAQQSDQCAQQEKRGVSQEDHVLSGQSISTVQYVCQWVPMATPLFAPIPPSLNSPSALHPKHWPAQNMQPISPMASLSWMYMVPYPQCSDMAQISHAIGNDTWAGGEALVAGKPQASSEAQAGSEVQAVGEASASGEAPTGDKTPVDSAWTPHQKPSHSVEILKPLERVLRRRGLGSGLNTPSSIGSPLPSSRFGSERQVSHFPTSHRLTLRAKTLPKFEASTLHIPPSLKSQHLSSCSSSSSLSSTTSLTYCMDVTTYTACASDSTISPPVEGAMLE